MIFSIYFEKIEHLNLYFMCMRFFGALHACSLLGCMRVPRSNSVFLKSNEINVLYIFLILFPQKKLYRAAADKGSHRLR